MLVFINGKEAEIAEQSTVGTLISERGLNPNALVVERNLAILPRDEWAQCVLTPEDKLEIITFVGGG